MPRPKNKKETQQFLGLANYYRKFIPSFAHIAVPLTSLTQKDAMFEWTEQQERSFKELKESLTKHPILRNPNWDRQFHIATDASDIAVVSSNKVVLLNNVIFFYVPFGTAMSR